MDALNDHVFSFFLTNLVFPGDELQIFVASTMKKWFYREMIWNYHYMKSVHIRCDSGPYFPAFGLNKEIYSVFLRIQFKFGKMQTRITLNTDTFHAVLSSWKRIQKISFLYGHNNLFQIDEQLSFLKKKKYLYTRHWFNIKFVKVIWNF